MKKQLQKSRVLIIIILVILVFITGVLIYFNNQRIDAPLTDLASQDSIDLRKLVEIKETGEDSMDSKNDSMMENTLITDNKNIKKIGQYQFSGNLKDVTGGKSIGTVQSLFKDGLYNMVANFENLPEPTGTDFYEGWIVRKGADFSVVSTGKLKIIDGEYINRYESDENLSDHLFYVLTIEPDDGDPDPAEHILEGTMMEI